MMTTRKLLPLVLAIGGCAALLLGQQPSRASFPGANGKIAFVSSRDGENEIFLMDADGFGQTQVTTNSADDTGPTWTPDGSKLLFASNRDGDHEIFVMNPGGSGQTQLTFNTANDGSPSSSPDGSKIAFASNRDGNLEIYVMNADGSGQTRLTNDAAADNEPFWSPDGSKIVFYSDRGGDLEIFVMNADGSSQTQLTDNSSINEVQPDWSPDGKQIVYARGVASAGAELDISVMDANGSGQTQLTFNPAGDSLPSFSPDGAKITFASTRNGDSDIFLMNADGTGQVPLTSDAASDFLPDWQVLPPTGPDADYDGVADASDNCPLVANHSQEDICTLQNGDFLVGVHTSGKGAIVRVRAGVATTFCESVGKPNNNLAIAGYFDTPKEVVIDSQGRVVFLGFMGTPAAPSSLGNWGLWRCDSMGETPILLGAFGGTQILDDLGYPQPLGNRLVRSAAGLHIKRTVGVDLNNVAMASHELYVFAVGDNPGLHHDTIAYDPATGHWTDSLEDPVENPQQGFDMIEGSGYTFSVYQNKIRGLLEPIALDFQIGEFVGGLAFQSLHDFESLIIDDKSFPNAGYDGCGPPPHGDDVPLVQPRNEAGGLNVMSGFYQIAYNDGFVIESDSGAAGRPYISNLDLTLFDLYPPPVPSNDESSMWHSDFPAPCSHQMSLGYTPFADQALNSYNDATGTPRSVDQMTPNGTAGTQRLEGRIVRVGPGEHVDILAEGIVAGSGYVDPTGIDVYPGYTPTTSGLTLFVQINSPVDVLITAPDGRKIGVDPNSGLPVNDYGAAGYDSQTNEPHVYGIRDPLPGNYSIATKGTGTGPYTITTYGANLGTEVITAASFTGSALPGSSSSHTAGLTSDGLVTNEDPATPTPTPAATDTPTATAVPSDTPTSTATDTPTATNTPTSTATDTPTATNTPTSTATDTPTATNTPSSTATDTPSSTATDTPTVTPAATGTPTPAPAIHCADVNGDGRVNLTDIVLVALHLGAREGSRRYEARFDLNSDGRIGLADVVIAFNQYGTQCHQ